MIELGVPFSDPMADGPTIQRASERALRSGTTLAGILALARRLRAKTEVPIVLFSYFNPILQMGLEKFATDAAKAGIDGVLVTDLTPEEAGEVSRCCARPQNLDTIFLAAPTSTDARLANDRGSDFGLSVFDFAHWRNGTRDALPEGLPALVRRARAATKLPIAVGFGISLPTHVYGAGRHCGCGCGWLGDSCGNREGRQAAGAAQAVGDLIRSLKEAAGLE